MAWIVSLFELPSLIELRYPCGEVLAPLVETAFSFFAFFFFFSPFSFGYFSIYGLCEPHAPPLISYPFRVLKEDSSWRAMASRSKFFFHSPFPPVFENPFWSTFPPYLPLQDLHPQGLKRTALGFIPQGLPPQYY